MNINIDEWFELPEEHRDFFVKLHNKQKQIRLDKERIDIELRKLATRKINLQMECEHPFTTKEYKAHENEFGNYTGGGQYYCHCEDCDRRWSEEK